MPDQDILANDLGDDILIMDESGEFKVLSNGQLKDYREEAMQKPMEPKVSILPMDTGMEEKMLQPPPPALIKKTASFYFHPEDEEEAAKHKIGPAAASQKRYSLEKIVTKVIDNYKLQLSEQLKTRLRAAIYNFLRDRRTLVDTQGVLKSAESGVGLEQAMVGNLSQFLKEIREKISREGGLVVDEQTEADGLKSRYMAPKEPARPVLAEKPSPNPPRPIPKADDENAGLKLRRDLEKQTAEVKGKLVAGPISSLPNIQRLAKNNGNRVADVKKDYKLVGPVDELAKLTLETFRRLGEDIRQRKDKVLGKINFLSQDSLTKRTAGIRAWQKSPLYKMYVAIGQSSLDHGLDVKKVIEEYQKSGRQIITLEEFEAVSDINRQLRF